MKSKIAILRKEIDRHTWGKVADYLKDADLIVKEISSHGAAVKELQSKEVIACIVDDYPNTAIQYIVANNKHHAQIIVYFDESKPPVRIDGVTYIASPVINADLLDRIMKKSDQLCASLPIEKTDKSKIKVIVFAPEALLNKNGSFRFLVEESYLYEILGQTKSPAELIEFINEKTPDLVFIGAISDEWTFLIQQYPHVKYIYMYKHSNDVLEERPNVVNIRQQDMGKVKVEGLIKTLMRRMRS